MNVDAILEALNRHNVQYMLVGGMNFLLRHSPILTFDIDIWIEDSDDNRHRCEATLSALNAEWGATDAEWGPVDRLKPGWLGRQGVFSLSTPSGAVDIFRSLCGLADWHSSRKEALRETTAAGIVYYGLSDREMLKCQLALDPAIQKRERIQTLQSRIGPIS